MRFDQIGHAVETEIVFRRLARGSWRRRSRLRRAGDGSSMTPDRTGFAGTWSWYRLSAVWRISCFSIPRVDSLASMYSKLRPDGL